MPSKWIRYPWGWYVIAIIPFVLALFFFLLLNKHVAITSTSPDGAFSVEIRQPRLLLLDRNFSVVLTDNLTKQRRLSVSLD